MRDDKSRRALSQSTSIGLMALLALMALPAFYMHYDMQIITWRALCHFSLCMLLYAYIAIAKARESTGVVVFCVIVCLCLSILLGAVAAPIVIIRD